jgi:hypothetical protein
MGPALLYRTCTVLRLTGSRSRRLLPQHLVLQSLHLEYALLTVKRSPNLSCTGIL